MTEQDILVVEDERDLRETLKDIFEAFGFRVMTAANGKEAFDRMADQGRPCFLLLDLMMPIMNGWEFINQFKKNYPHIFKEVPIVIMSAVADTAEVSEQYQCEVLKKPLDIQHLIKLASHYCNLKGS